MYLNRHFQIPIVPLQNVSAYREIFDAGEVLWIIMWHHSRYRIGIMRVILIR